MSAITAGTTPQAITVPAGTADLRLYIQNRGTAEVFIGPNANVTATNGIGLAVGATLEYPERLHPAPSAAQSGYDLWLVTASGTADVRWVML